MKLIDKLAIAAMAFGGVALLTIVFNIGWSYTEAREKAAHQRACEDAALILATTTLCLKDKDFKCFVTPKDYREFALAAKTHKEQQCEAK